MYEIRYFLLTALITLTATTGFYVLHGEKLSYHPSSPPEQQPSTDKGENLPNTDIPSYKSPVERSGAEGIA